MLSASANIGEAGSFDRRPADRRRVVGSQETGVPSITSSRRALRRASTRKRRLLVRRMRSNSQPPAEPTPGNSGRSAGVPRARKTGRQRPGGGKPPAYAVAQRQGGLETPAIPCSPGDLAFRQPHAARRWLRFHHARDRPMLNQMERSGAENQRPVNTPTVQVRGCCVSPLQVKKLIADLTAVTMQFGAKRG